jgi:hypothetical protein
MSYEKALEDAIDSQLGLLKRNRKLMEADIASGKLSARTLTCVHTAQESFKAARLHMQQNKHSDAVYLFNRGCWNMGEVMGRSFYEKQGLLSDSNEAPS